jgi:hypothetical protein
MTYVKQDMSRQFAQYISDDGNTYLVGTTVQDATAGGFASGTPGGLPPYPRGWKMRRVFCTSANGRCTVPISDPASSNWSSNTGPFGLSKNGQTYAIVGWRGERRTFKGG